VGEVVKALAGTRHHAKLYALRYYARHKAERDQLPLLVDALGAARPDVREAALAALACYGPDCKPAAFDKLLKLALDPDKRVADAAAELVVSKFKSYDESDKVVLRRNLVDLQPELRALSVRLIVPAGLAPDEREAVAWLRGRLRDNEKSPKVWQAAAEELGKLGGGGEGRRAGTARAGRGPRAVRAGGRRGGARRGRRRAEGGPGAGQVPVAHRRAASARGRRPGPHPDRVRPGADLPVLEQMLTVKDLPPDLRAAALGRAAALEEKGLPLLKRVVGWLDSADPAVCAAALRAVAAVAPAVTAAKDGSPRRDAALADQVKGLVGKKFEARLESPPRPADVGPVTERALDVLVKLGPAGADRLAELIAAPLPRDVRAAVIERLRALGPALPALAARTLVQIAEAEPDARAVVEQTLVACANDAVSEALVQKYKWTYDKKIRRSANNVAEDVHLWVLRAMGELPVKSLSDKGRAALLDHLKNHGMLDPRPELKAAASNAHAKLTAALKK
jgi:HEAT repeat protein